MSSRIFASACKSTPSEMASTDQDPEWVRRLKLEGGAVPLLDSVENCISGWASPPGNYFQVRGPNYLATRAKIRGGEWILKPLAFDWVKSSTKIFDVMRHPNGRVGAALKKATRTDKCTPFVWVFNLQVPSKENHSLIFYFFSYCSPLAGSLVQQFLHADATYRNSRLKLIANVAKGPWIVKKAVGEQAVCIPGKAVSCEYFQSDNFIEVDIDIGASVMANAIVHLAFGYVTSLTVDIAFVIEGCTENELPEKILGAIRFSNLDPLLATSIEMPLEDGKIEKEPGSLRSRLWRSFSSLLHVGHLEPENHECDKHRMANANYYESENQLLVSREEDEGRNERE